MAMPSDLFLKLLLALAMIWCVVEIYRAAMLWADAIEEEQDTLDDDLWY